MMYLSIAPHSCLLPPKTLPNFKTFRSQKYTFRPIIPNIHSIKSLQRSHKQQPEEKPKWKNILSTAASLYPLYVSVGGLIACAKPSAYSWFVRRGPVSYSLSLGFIMLVMGLTLEFKDLINIFFQRPLSILFGFVAQYTIMPAFGAIIGKFLGLPPSILVTLIAQGDVPLSIVMTVCTTLGAVLLTPLLVKILAGAYVPVDAVKLSISTLQVVVGPVLLGSYMQSTFPNMIKLITPFAPLLAVLTSSLLASSVFSENVVRLRSSMLPASLGSGQGPLAVVWEILSGELGVVVLSVLLLHFAGFFVGYIAAAVCGFKEAQRRAISIEVGMQNSSLGVVLATSHFTSPLVALPLALSAVLMNIMGSSLGFIWGCIDPSDKESRNKNGAM